MPPRDLAAPKSAFFLFGPRGTGKSTWVPSLLASMKADSYIVYLGDRELVVDGTRVLPVDTFLRRLHAGDIVG